MQLNNFSSELINQARIKYLYNKEKTYNRKLKCNTEKCVEAKF